MADISRKHLARLGPHYFSAGVAVPRESRGVCSGGPVANGLAISRRSSDAPHSRRRRIESGQREAPVGRSPPASEPGVVAGVVLDVGWAPVDEVLLFFLRVCDFPVEDAIPLLAEVPFVPLIPLVPVPFAPVEEPFVPIPVPLPAVPIPLPDVPAVPDFPPMLLPVPPVEEPVPLELVPEPLPVPPPLPLPPPPPPCAIAPPTAVSAANATSTAFIRILFIAVPSCDDCAKVRGRRQGKQCGCPVGLDERNETWPLLSTDNETSLFRTQPPPARQSVERLLDSGCSRRAVAGRSATSAARWNCNIEESDCMRNANAIHFTHEVRCHSSNPGRARVACRA